jgi:hypothetical protein
MRIFLLSLLIVLTGCTHKNLVKLGDTIDPTSEGAIVFKVYGATGQRGYSPEDMLQVVFRKDNSQKFSSTLTSNREYTIKRMAPGTWYIAYLSPNQIVIPAPYFSSDHYEDSQPVPVKRFTVKEGEVLYLGELVVSEITRNKPLNGTTRNVTYTVEDNLEAAEKDAQEILYDNYDGYQPIKKSLFVPVE